MLIVHTSDADPEPEVVEHNIVLVQSQFSRNVELTKNRNSFKIFLLKSTVNGLNKVTIIAFMVIEENAVHTYFIHCTGESKDRLR